MHRIILDVPALGIAIRAADFFVVLAVVVAVVIGPRWAERLEGLDRRAVRRALLVLAVVTLAGARLHFIINYPEAFASHPLAALKLWTGGLHIPGGILALALAAPWVTARFGIPVGRFGDGITPAVGVGIAVARLGCFLQGCCFGTTCDYAWCVTFPADASPFYVHRDMGLLPPDATHSLAVHPLQLYFAASGLAITAMALWLRRHKRYDGQVALVGLLMFSLVSVAGLESFRADYRPRVFWGPLPQLTWTGLAMGAGTVVVLAIAALRQRRSVGRIFPASVESGRRV